MFIKVLVPIKFKVNCPFFLFHGFFICFCEYILISFDKAVKIYLSLFKVKLTSFAVNIRWEGGFQSAAGTMKDST